MLERCLKSLFSQVVAVEMPLWSAHVGVEDRDTTESIFESASGLRCQTDFRHEDDRLTTETDRPFDRLHVDFGLSTPCHTVQEYRRMLPRVERFVDGLQGNSLIGG